MSTVFILNTLDKVMQQYQDQDQVNWPKVVEIKKFSLHMF